MKNKNRFSKFFGEGILKERQLYYSCRKGKVIEMKLKDASSEIFRTEKSGRSFKGIGVKLCIGAAMILAAGAISLSVFTGEIEAADSLIKNETEQTQENSADMNVYEAQAPALTAEIQTEKITSSISKTTTAIKTEQTTEATTVTTTEAATQAAITHALKTTSKAKTTTSVATTKAKTTKAFKTYEMYTNDELNLRSGAGTGYSKVTVIPNASLVTVTGNAKDGWYPVKYNGKSGYVFSMYLQSTKPKMTTTTVITTKAKTQSSAKSTSTSSKLLGTFKVTAYCSCESCCGAGSTGHTASGTKATAGRTIAASSKYAFGTKLMFNGNVYTVEDRGGSIDGNVIDLYFDSHQEACNWGVRYCDVYLVG